MNLFHLPASSLICIIFVQFTKTKTKLFYNFNLCFQLYDELKNGSISVSNFLKCDDVHPVGMLEEKAINWIFVVDTLNFCFWAAKNDSWWEITHEGNKYSGYFGLCAAINKAIKVRKI